MNCVLLVCGQGQTHAPRTQRQSLQQEASQRHGASFLIAEMSVADGMCVLASTRKRLVNSLPRLLACTTLAGGATALTGCGGGAKVAARLQSSVITVNGSSGSVQAYTTATPIAEYGSATFYSHKVDQRRDGISLCTAVKGVVHDPVSRMSSRY